MYDVTLVRAIIRFLSDDGLHDLRERNVVAEGVFDQWQVVGRIWRVPKADGARFTETKGHPGIETRTDGAA